MIKWENTREFREDNKINSCIQDYQIYILRHIAGYESQLTHLCLILYFQFHYYCSRE